MKYVSLEPDAFLRDPDYIMMTCEERGAYVSLILFLTAKNGEIRINGGDNGVAIGVAIGGLMGSAENPQKLWEKVSHKFEITDGVITHSRVTKELERSNARQKQASENGKRGAAKRWNKADPVTWTPHSDPIANNYSIYNRARAVLNKKDAEANGDPIATPSQVRELYTKDQFTDAALGVGLPDDEAVKCWEYYRGQDFEYSNGKPIRKPADALTRWRNNQHKFNGGNGTQQKSVADIAAGLKAKGEL